MGADACQECQTGSPPAADSSPSESAADSVILRDEGQDWIAIALIREDGRPWPGAGFEVILPDGKSVAGNLDQRGRVRIEGIGSGTCRVRFPTLDRDAWERL
jgi:hypothetical protein